WQACESLGYSRAELLGMNVADFEQDVDRARAKEIWARVQPGTAETVSGLHRRKNGSVFPVEARVSACTINGERLYVCLIRDVTERERAAKRLRMSNEDLQAYAYTVSHDLQEPIRTVALYTDLLQRRHAAILDKDGREFLQIVHSGALRMIAMLKDLLMYSRAGEESDLEKSVDAGAA